MKYNLLSHQFAFKNRLASENNNMFDLSRAAIKTRVQLKKNNEMVF